VFLTSSAILSVIWVVFVSVVFIEDACWRVSMLKRVVVACGGKSFQKDVPPNGGAGARAFKSGAWTTHTVTKFDSRAQLPRPSSLPHLIS
jgi:hypothetical protein